MNRVRVLRGQVRLFSKVSATVESGFYTGPSPNPSPSPSPSPSPVRVSHFSDRGYNQIGYV